jgi:heterogeneous nuclear ribonucleoprotein M
VRGARPPREDGGAPRGGRGGFRGGRGGGRGGAVAGGGGGGAPAGVPGTSVFVGNLPWSFDWKMLKDLFSAYNPGYADVKIGSDGRSRGYGIVRFDSPESAAAAIAALNGTAVGDPPREIVVREDRPAP